VTEHFSPGVRLTNGRTITPRGWEWILAFAMAGCDWAIQEADKPGFREYVRAELVAAETKKLLALIADRHKEIDALFARLDALR